MLDKYREADPLRPIHRRRRREGREELALSLPHLWVLCACGGEGAIQSISLGFALASLTLGDIRLVTPNCLL